MGDGLGGGITPRLQFRWKLQARQARSSAARNSASSRIGLTLLRVYHGMRSAHNTPIHCCMVRLLTPNVGWRVWPAPPTAQSHPE